MEIWGCDDLKMSVTSSKSYNLLTFSERVDDPILYQFYIFVKPFSMAITSIVYVV